MAKGRRLPPVHPGEILREEFMVPLGLTSSDLALALHVPVRSMRALLKGHRSITADTALRLARHLVTTPDLWMRLQMCYDLDVAVRASATQIRKDVRPLRKMRQRGRPI